MHHLPGQRPFDEYSLAIDACHAAAFPVQGFDMCQSHDDQAGQAARNSCQCFSGDVESVERNSAISRA